MWDAGQDAVAGQVENYRRAHERQLKSAAEATGRKKARVRAGPGPENRNRGRAARVLSSVSRQEAGTRRHRVAPAPRAKTPERRWADG